MPFMPQGQPAAQGNVAQMGRMGMGLGAMQRPALSGSAIKRGPNVSRMDPMAGQLQSAMLQRSQGMMGGPPPGAPPPPNPGLGPSQPAMQNLVQGAAGMFGQQPMQTPDLPEMQSNGETPNPQMIQDRQNYMDEAGKMMGQGGDPMMDRRNAMMSMMSKMNQGGPFGQRPDVMPRGPMNQGPMIGNGMAANFGNGMMKPPGNPMAARGLGPSFMGNAQPIQQAPPPAPPPQRRFGGGMNQGPQAY